MLSVGSFGKHELHGQNSRKKNANVCLSCSKCIKEFLEDFGPFFSSLFPLESNMFMVACVGLL